MIEAGILGVSDVWSQLWSLHIPAPMALAAVALIGYLFGQYKRKALNTETEQARRELKRVRDSSAAPFFLSKT